MMSEVGFELTPPFGTQKFSMSHKRKGAGASKFLGVRKTFSGILPNLPETFLCDFCIQIFSNKDHENLFWCDLQKQVFVRFSANVGCHFLK